MNKNGNKGLIVVPVYNEETALSRVIEKLKGRLDNCSVLFINDGSIDKTSSILEEMGCWVISHPINMGYIEALRTGVEVALIEGYDFIIFFDGDGQHRTEDLNKVIKYYEENKSEVDVIVGARAVGAASFARRFLSKIFFIFVRLVSGLSVRDTTSGMKLLSKRAMIAFKNALLEDGHAELLVYFSLMGIRVREVPIKVEERQSGSSMYHLQKLIFYPLRTCYLIFGALLHRIIQGKLKI